MRSWCVLLLAATAVFGAAISIRFEKVPQESVEKRLQAAPGKNAGREPVLVQMFRDAGCGPEQLSEQPVKHAKSPNVICVWPGEMPESIVIGAHFDFVESGRGVIDNWSGAALLPTLLQSIKSDRRRHTFRLIGFTDEEKGLVGSHYYVQNLSRDEKEQISAMINLDSLGAGPTNVELDRGDKTLANALWLVSQTYHLPLSIVNVHRIGRSDSDSFQDAHIPSLNVHSLTRETWKLLHNKRDQLEAIHLDDYYNSYRLMAAYLTYLDQVLDSPEQPPKQ